MPETLNGRPTRGNTQSSSTLLDRYPIKALQPNTAPASRGISVMTGATTTGFLS